MTKKIVRSRTCGLKDFYIARVTENTPEAYTADAPEKLARMIEAKISDKFTVEKIYSDDSVEDVVTSYEGTDIELTINTMQAPDHKVIMDRMYKNGYLLKAAEDRALEVAIGYRTRRMNGKYDFVWYYCGRFEPGQEHQHKTMEGKVEGTTITLKGSFYQREKEDEVLSVATGETERRHLYSIVVDESNLAEDATAAAAAIKKWFSEVQEYSENAVANGT